MAAAPTAVELPPQCQPAFRTPTPGLERTIPVIAHDARADRDKRANVVIEGIHLGHFTRPRPSTFGSVIGAGGLNTAPDGWMVTMNRGCWPKPGTIGTLSA